MQKALPVATAILLILLCTVGQGVFTYRFHGHRPSETLNAMAERLGRVPMTIGDWVGRDEESTDERVELVAGIVGSVNRTYERANGDRVSIALVCGDRRNMTTHTPERCMAASGFNMSALGARPFQLPVARNEQGEITEGVRFLTATFKKDDPRTGRLLQQIFWAWNADGKWIAPEADARLPQWLGGLPPNKSWYKLYIMCSIERSFDDRYGIQDTPAYKFAEELLPVLNQVLADHDFPTQASANP